MNKNIAGNSFIEEKKSGVYKNLFSGVIVKINHSRVYLRLWQEL